MKIEVEVKASNRHALNKIEKIAMECGGIVTERKEPEPSLMTGWQCYQMSGDDLSDFGKELFGLKERK